MTQAMDAPAKTRAQISERTLRRDPWWRAPAITAALLTIWVAYATVHVFLGRWYWVPQYHYLTPFYSPCVSGSCAAGSSSLGQWFGKVPSIVPYAVVSLPFVLGFRLSCYYYRKAYYRAFWADPPACGVGEPRKSYWGENSLPLILQNVHRYFLYLALIFIALLSWDFVQGCRFKGDDGHFQFGLGVGSFVLLLNVVLLGGYTFGCHSFRHLVGGYRDQLASAPTQKKVYDCVSCLNRRHMLFAWCSLFWVGFTDVYVRLCSMGVWTDNRII